MLNHVTKELFFLLIGVWLLSTTQTLGEESKSTDVFARGLENHRVRLLTGKTILFDRVLKAPSSSPSSILKVASLSANQRTSQPLSVFVDERSIGEVTLGKDSSEVLFLMNAAGVIKMEKATRRPITLLKGRSASDVVATLDLQETDWRQQKKIIIELPSSRILALSLSPKLIEKAQQIGRPSITMRLANFQAPAPGDLYLQVKVPRQ